MTVVPADRQGDQFRILSQDVTPEGVVQFWQSKVKSWQIAWLTEETMQAIAGAGGFERALICPWDYTGEHFRKEFKRLAKLAGFHGISFKILRKSSSSNVESRHRGWGDSHLGHASGSKVGHQSYFDRSITEAERPRPEPLRL